MNKVSKDNLIFAGIILLASILRLWNYWNWSFTHDELGAFVRLNYSSFSELIAQGVRDNDTHPAFTQLFIFFWAKLFGLSEASIRLPFVAAGVGSVALLYSIAKSWFGTTTADFSATALAILEFPILYSQLARPYSFGLFFSLLTVWYWNKLLFSSNKKILQNTIAYGLATALCMLTHYFAFFFAMIVALTGFIYLKKETWKYYIGAGIIALLLFLPHLSISLHQFSMGGIGQWLAKPEKDFLWKYILYGLNDSPFLLAGITSVVLLSILVYHLDLTISKFQIISIVWFIIPFIVGYLYSVLVNPVIQYSTLLFSFPFLLIFIFSFFKEGKEKFNQLTLGGMSALLLFSTVIEKRFYAKEEFGVFKEINQIAAELQSKYGSENITTMLNTSSKEIFNFYFEKEKTPVKFDFYIGDDSTFVPHMLQKIDSCNSLYILYGWSNFRSPYEIPEIIKRKYPCVLFDEKHFNSQITLFAKECSDTMRRDTILYAYTEFENDLENFILDAISFDSSIYYSGKRSIKLNPTNKYGVTYRTTVKQLFKDNYGCVNISAWIYSKTDFNAQFVMDIGQPTGKRDWQAKLLQKYIIPEKANANTKKEGWHQIFVTFQIPETAYPDDEVKLHFWNPGNNSFYIDNFTVSSFADSKYNHYLVSYRK